MKTVTKLIILLALLKLDKSMDKSIEIKFKVIVSFDNR
jgi:hypothetical protein